MFGNAIANMVTLRGDCPIFNNPADYGLDYEDVTFKATDGVKLSGWLVKGDSDKVIIQTHFASQCCRSGYTPQGKGMIKLWDTDISFLNQAKYLNEAGYSILLFDFRNHGKSEKGTNKYVTGGPEESKDVIAAVDFISKHPTYRDARIGLFSICMGTNATSFAFGVEGGLDTYENIKAYISVQPLGYGDFMRNMGIPAFLVRSGNKANIERGGIDFEEQPFENLKSVHCPVLLIQNMNDPWTHLPSVQKYFDSIPTEKEYLKIEIEKKRAAAYEWVGKNSTEILGWFDRYIK